MRIYNYLLSKEANLSPFPEEHSYWDVLCVWTVRNIFGARYWHDVAMAQADTMSAYKKAFRESLKAKESV